MDFFFLGSSGEVLPYIDHTHHSWCQSLARQTWERERERERERGRGEGRGREREGKSNQRAGQPPKRAKSNFPPITISITTLLNSPSSRVPPLHFPLLVARHPHFLYFTSAARSFSTQPKVAFPICLPYESP